VPDADLLAQVYARLLAVVPQPPGNVAWPPPISLTRENELNAYAALQVERLPYGRRRPRVDKNGKFVPYIVVDQQLMDDLIQGEADRLAMVVGHELSHILLGHILPTSMTDRPRTGAWRIVFTAEQEHEADIHGIKLALAAGYSYRGAREVWEVWTSDAFRTKHPGANPSSFEAVGVDHPSITDRLSYLDQEKANIWKAMSAFENGTVFLAIQQYPAAEESFSRVVAEFPDSYEGWANLGYARLMMYLDAFDADDLKRYDIGQVVVGSFYLRPEALRASIRGVNARTWQKAVDALRKALALKPDLSLAKANLGIAYLLSPAGRDAQRASALLEQAVVLLDSDKTIVDFNRGAVLINASVANLANGQTELAARRLDQAGQIAQEYPTLSGASDYNRALLALRASEGDQAGARSVGDRRRYASTLLVNFLGATTPASVWWSLGYDRYAGLMKEQGLEPQGKQDFAAGKQVRLRPIPSVEIAPGTLVTLSDRVELVKDKVKPLVAVPVAGTTIEVLHHPPSGTDMVAGRRVVAIYLQGPQAPRLKVQPFGTGAPGSMLGIGMARAEVEKLLGKNYMVAPLHHPEVSYYFYPALGVGIRYDRLGRVAELALAQIAIE
jgi:tetratricopeptide (TPR) repeat protein